MRLNLRQVVKNTETQVLDLRLKSHGFLYKKFNNLVRVCL